MDDEKPKKAGDWEDSRIGGPLESFDGPSVPMSPMREGKILSEGPEWLSPWESFDSEPKLLKLLSELPVELSSV